MYDFSELRKFPFTLTWPKGEDERDLVCAASTSADRAQWVEAIERCIARANASGPRAGWLYKQARCKSRCNRCVTDA